MFKFGENWASFSRLLNEERVEEAKQSLLSLFDQQALRGHSFLDIGCGSGLFAIAAAQLGAKPVVGIDIDPLSVRVSEENARRFVPQGTPITFFQLSVLDSERMRQLGQFDVVYAWGVLHHTGQMDQAIRQAAQCVKPGGWLMIAIYNRHWSSGIWKRIKWFYNRIGKMGQRALVWLFTPPILVAKALVTRQNPFKMRRGMDFMHNVVDWLGGYPYEYASIAEMQAYLSTLGFEIVLVRPANTPTGCNEYLSRRTLG